ncbi:hypothetical protein VTI74DRAFT_5363 [Chaetomium olivicolor]
MTGILHHHGLNKTRSTIHLPQRANGRRSGRYDPQPNHPEPTLDIVYEQIADSRLESDTIGVLSNREESHNAWAVTGSALTFNMNELATNTGYTADQFPVAPFHRAGEYLQAVARQHLLHHKTPEGPFINGGRRPEALRRPRPDPTAHRQVLR